MRILEESFGARAEERFEQKQEEYLAYRRAPGQSIAAYISTLKRLRGEYLKEDTETTISDKSFAQRLLSRAALTRRERMDIFFSSGGKYNLEEEPEEDERHPVSREVQPIDSWGIHHSPLWCG